MLFCDFDCQDYLFSIQQIIEPIQEVIVLVPPLHKNNMVYSILLPLLTCV